MFPLFLSHRPNSNFLSTSLSRLEEDNARTCTKRRRVIRALQVSHQTGVPVTGVLYFGKYDILEAMAVTPFEQKVYAIVRRIPKGKTMTYGAVAAAVGLPRAARAVGNALNKNPFSFRLGGNVPCHRVIRSDGSIGGFASGPKAKLQLLKQEGALHA